MLLLAGGAPPRSPLAPTSCDDMWELVSHQPSSTSYSVVCRMFLLPWLLYTRLKRVRCWMLQEEALEEEARPTTLLALPRRRFSVARLLPRVLLLARLAVALLLLLLALLLLLLLVFPLCSPRLLWTNLLLPRPLLPVAL